MITRLIKRGDAYFLEIDPALLNELQIDENTLLEVSKTVNGLALAPADGGSSLPPTDDISDEEFHAALDKVNRNYDNALKRLAE